VHRERQQHFSDFLEGWGEQVKRRAGGWGRERGGVGSEVTHTALHQHLQHLQRGLDFVSVDGVIVSIQHVRVGGGAEEHI